MEQNVRVFCENLVHGLGKRTRAAQIKLRAAGLCGFENAAGGKRLKIRRVLTALVPSAAAAAGVVCHADMLRPAVSGDKTDGFVQIAGIPRLAGVKEGVCAECASNQKYLSAVLL